MPVTTYKSETEWTQLEKQHVYLPEMIAEPLRELNRRKGDRWRVARRVRRASWWCPWEEDRVHYTLYCAYSGELPDVQVIAAGSGRKENTAAYLMGYLSGLDRAESQ